MGTIDEQSGQYLRPPVKPGSISNGIVQHHDWLPTFLAMAGAPDVVEKLKEGYQAIGRTYKNHIDGFNLLPYLTGEAKESPRNFYFYFSDDGDMPPAFRQMPYMWLGLRPNSGHSPKLIQTRFRKAGGIPHIRRHSRYNKANGRAAARATDDLRLSGARPTLLPSAFCLVLSSLLLFASLPVKTDSYFRF